MYVMVKLQCYGVKFTREKYDLIRSIPQLDLKPWKEDGAEEQDVSLWGEYLIDMVEDGPKLIEAGAKFEVIRFKNTYIPSQASRYNNYDLGRQGPSNPTIQISIPNIGLLAIDEVYLLEDACTNELQGMLTDGWRIVAVCPPNAARRPDYVLGRTKPNA